MPVRAPATPVGSGPPATAEPIKMRRRAPPITEAATGLAVPKDLTPRGFAPKGLAPKGFASKSFASGGCLSWGFAPKRHVPKGSVSRGRA